MNKRYKSYDNIDFKSSSLSNNNIFHSGGKNIMLGSKFDIKKYLIEIDKRNKEETSPNRSNINKLKLLYPIITPKPDKLNKLNNISTESNKISSINNNSKYFNTIGNESNNTHKNRYIYNTNYSSKNIYQGNHLKNSTLINKGGNCFLTSLGIEQKQRNNKLKTIDSRDYMITLNPNNNRLKRLFSINNKVNRNYHVSSVIKEIKEKYKNKDENDIKNDYIAYKTENINAVLNSKKLLNDYNEKKEWNLKLEENNFYKFTNNNKKIYKQNILTKLINRERGKIIKNEENYIQSIRDKKNDIINDEKLFDTIVIDQKQNNKTIEDYRIKLEKINKDLYFLKDVMNSKVQNKEGEIMKKLFEMEELRTYAKFVNNMLGNDVSRYEKVIYPMEYERNIEIDELVKNALDIYGDFLNQKNNIQDDNENYPEIIYNGFLGLEDKIRYGIKIKDEEFEKIKKLKKDNDMTLDRIKEKKSFLESQYKTIIEECISIKKEISKERNEETYLYYLAQDLFNYILEIFSYENRNKNKDIGNMNLMKISDLAEKTKNCFCEKESFINKYIKNIESYEKENPILFEEIIDLTKSKIILQNQKEAKELALTKERIKKIQAIQKLEKINFIMRKIEEPFHIKKKEKVKYDAKAIKQKEDKELITYQ